MSKVNESISRAITECNWRAWCCEALGERHRPGCAGPERADLNADAGTCVHTHACTHAYTYATCTYKQMHTEHMHVPAHVGTPAHPAIAHSTCRCVCTGTHMCTHRCICATHACMHTDAHTSHTHAHTHTDKFQRGAKCSGLPKHGGTV